MRVRHYDYLNDLSLPEALHIRSIVNGIAAKQELKVDTTLNNLEFRLV